MGDETNAVQCCYPGCVAKGTHRIVLLLLSLSDAAGAREPITQKRDLDPYRRCKGHTEDKDPDVLIKRFGWSPSGVRNQLAMGFEAAARRKFGERGAGVFPDWYRTTVEYVPEDIDIAEIPIFVEVPGGAEQVGTAKVHG